MQGRLCELDTYAKYREYASLSVPTSFTDISSDPRVVQLLRAHYQSPADVEFYIRLFAEDTLNNSALPELLQYMEAVDAFSQALTNPLLSEHVFNERTFSTIGWKAIQSTHSLQELLARNSNWSQLGRPRISMTQQDWKYR